MSQQDERKLQIARRHFFKECGVGIGKIALASLLTDAFASGAASAQNASPRNTPIPGGQGGGHAMPNPLAPRKPHFTAKAKRVIHLFMAGAPSQLDLFDFKPELTKYEGKPIPPSVIN